MSIAACSPCWAATSAWPFVLGVANIVLAGLQFLDPVLFGRVIGLLSTSDTVSRDALWTQAATLIGFWVVIAAVSIGANIATVVHAERMAHRNRLQAMSRYFSHVLSLPLSFHGEAHSGRLMKVMLAGRRLDVRRLADLLPRATRDLRGAAGAAAADAAAELAAEPGADRARGHLLHRHHRGDPAHRGRAEARRAVPVQPGRHRAGCAGQRDRGAVLHPAGRRDPPLRPDRRRRDRAPIPGAELVGRGQRADPRCVHHRGDRDRADRHHPARERPGHDRRRS